MLYKKADQISIDASIKVQFIKNLAGNIHSIRKLDDETLNLLSNNEPIFGKKTGYLIFSARSDILDVAEHYSVVHNLSECGDPLCQKIINNLHNDESVGIFDILINSPIPSQMILRTMPGEDYDSYLNGEKSITGPGTKEYFLK